MESQVIYIGYGVVALLSVLIMYRKWPLLGMELALVMGVLWPLGWFTIAYVALSPWRRIETEKMEQHLGDGSASGGKNGG